MKRSLTFSWLVAAAVAVFVLLQLPGYLMARVPKSGRVVDSTTGKGIPDATVIAWATFSACGGVVESRCSSTTEYRLLTRTDQDGNYWIRNNYLSGIMPLIPIVLSDRRESWQITVIKPGYAVVGDHVAWTYLDRLGNARLYPPSTSDEPPPASSFVLFARVDPIPMYRVDLDLKQSSLYFAGLLRGGSGRVDQDMWNEPEETALRQHLYAPLQASVCGQPAATELDYGTFSALLILAPDGTAFLAKAKQLDPNLMKDPSPERKYKAAIVCDEMKAANHEQTVRPRRKYN